MNRYKQLITRARAGAGGKYIFEGTISPAGYAAYQPVWHAAGARMIGGCCGIGPSHIETLAATMGR